MRNTSINSATPPDRRGVPVAAIISLFAFLSFSLPALAGPKNQCSCEHLSEIRRALRDKDLLRIMYESKARELEAVEGPLLKALIKERGRAAADSAEMTKLRKDYADWSETDALDALAEGTAGSPGASSRRGKSATFDQETCEVNPSALKRLQSDVACRDLAEVLQRHEDYHHDVCVARKNRQEPRRTSEPIDENLVSADALWYARPSSSAREEVAAYTGDVAVLKALIDKLTRDHEYVLHYKSVFRTDWKVPMGEMGTAAEYASTARMPLVVEKGPAPQHVSGSTVRIFEARLIGGACQYTGMPLRIRMTVDGTLDNGKFKLKFDKEGIHVPASGVRCPLGGSVGGGPRMEAPGLPGGVEIEAKDGAKSFSPS